MRKLIGFDFHATSKENLGQFMKEKLKVRVIKRFPAIKTFQKTIARELAA